MAEGLSSGLMRGQGAADRVPFDPALPPSEPHFGIHPDFPNSFSTHFGE
jgi:hypothetical protein